MQFTNRYVTEFTFKRQLFTLRAHGAHVRLNSNWIQLVYNFTIIFFVLRNIFQITRPIVDISALLQLWFQKKRKRKKTVYKSQTRGTPSKFKTLNELSCVRFVSSSNCRIVKRFFFHFFFFSFQCLAKVRVGTCLQTFCHVYFFAALPEVLLPNWGGYDRGLCVERKKNFDEPYQSDDIWV